MAASGDNLSVAVSIGSIEGLKASVTVTVASQEDIYGNRALPGSNWEGTVDIERKSSIEQIELLAMRTFFSKLSSEYVALSAAISSAEAGLQHP